MAESYISKIKLPSGSTYTIKDTKAWEDIATLSGLVQGGVHYIGKTTTVLVDEATTNPIKIDGVDVTAKQGDMVSAPNPAAGQQDIEFVFNGTKWYEVGAFGSLKALAYKDSASGTYTPNGNVTLTKESKSASLANGAATAKALTGLTATTSANYTPNGSVSIDYTPAGSVTLGEYTPNGSVVIPSIAPSADSITVTKPTGEGTFTPGTTTKTFSGSITALPTLTANAPDVTVTPSTTGVLATATVTDGVLSFGSTNVLSSATAALNAAPTVGYSTTTAATQDLGSNAIAISTSGTVLSGGTVSVGMTTETKSITINELTNIAGKFTGLSVDFGTKSLSGTGTTLTADLSGTAATITGSATVQDFTPQITSVTGDVTITNVPTGATFSGTSATIKVS